MPGAKNNHNQTRRRQISVTKTGIEQGESEVSTDPTIESIARKLVELSPLVGGDNFM